MRRRKEQSITRQTCKFVCVLDEPFCGCKVAGREPGGQVGASERTSLDPAARHWRPLWTASCSTTEVGMLLRLVATT